MIGLLPICVGWVTLVCMLYLFSELDVLQHWKVWRVALYYRSDVACEGEGCLVLEVDNFTYFPNVWYYIGCV